MTRRSKILTGIAVSVAGLIAIAVLGVILVIRTEWFSNYVREKIVSLTEESTGGKVDLKSFQFEWRQLRAELHGFVIHGTEPAGSAPLFEASSIVLRLKLLTGLKKPIDLEYLGVDKPSANIIVFPNGQTNIPTPKVVKTSNKSGLETVIDLAIHRFEINGGSVQFLQRKTEFSAKGEDVRAQLAYNPATPRYQGEISMRPLYLVSGRRRPLNATVTVPLELERDAVRVTNAKIATPESNFTVTGTLRNLASPEISGQLNAHISLVELTRSLDIQIHPERKGAPQGLDAEVSVRSSPNTIEIQNARLSLGRTQLQASGRLKDPTGNAAANFHGELLLDELAKLMDLPAQPSGSVQLSGNAKVNTKSEYLVNANIDARDVSLRQGTTRLRGIRLVSGVQVDPHILAIKDAKLSIAGGELLANARIEELSNLRLQGKLRGFSIRNLTALLMPSPIAYAGTISGEIEAHGNLKAPGAEGISAQAHLAITPGGAGVPVSGRINANYDGSKSAVELNRSVINLPNSRLELAGVLGKQAHVRLVSRNLNDFLPVLAASTSPPRQMPVTLNGGVATIAADFGGRLESPSIAAHASITNFAVEQRRFDQFAADLTASSSGAVLRNASLTRKSLQAQFAGSVGLHDWSALPSDPIALTATVRNADLADVLALAGEAQISATGALEADARISGTVGNPLGNANFTVVNGTVYQEPFDRLQTTVNFSDQRVELPSLQLTAGPARIDGRGSFTHPRDSFGTGSITFHVASNDVQLSQFQTLRKERPASRAWFGLMPIWPEICSK